MDRQKDGAAQGHGESGEGKEISEGAGGGLGAANGKQGQPAPQTVSFYEKHKKIYPKAVYGRFAKLRWLFIALTQAFFYLAPWIELDGRQALLLDLAERKFYVWGALFWPQDVIYLAVLLIVSAYGLFFVTAVAGRVFCGYACPQTVYTEIFLWIEHWVEGDRAARIKLDKQPLLKGGAWGKPIWKKAAKHGVWAALSLWTGFTFVAYFAPARDLAARALAGSSWGPWETFWVFFYGGFTYLMAGHLREQVCKYMCPYARFQSMMFDADTMVVSYDEKRGEARSALKKGEDRAAAGKGDCVDCGMCVQVCPVGIDIRKGLQYECIGCAACIDACDDVMEKVGFPKGLVGYSTENALKEGWGGKRMFKRIARPRVALYFVLLCAVCSAAGWSLWSRVPLRADLIKDRSVLSRELDDGRQENVYLLRLMNAYAKPLEYEAFAGGMEGIEAHLSQPAEVGGWDKKEFALSLSADCAGASGSNKVWVEIRAKGMPQIQVREKAVFSCAK